MIISWQGFEFTLVQGGLGTLKEDVAGHVHSQKSYELHYIVIFKCVKRKRRTCLSMPFWKRHFT